MNDHIVHGNKCKALEETIVKGWDKTRIIKTFKNIF